MIHSVRFFSHAWLLPLLLLAGACDPTLEPQPSPYPVPEGGEAAISLDCTSFHRFAEADSVVVVVTADENASFDVQIPDAALTWISTSTLHDNKSGCIGFRIDENKSGQDRTAAIVFRYGKNSTYTVHINQEGDYRTACYEKWGILGNILAEKRNTRPYHWYVDQGNTGPMSNNNCGPSCVTMAAKWHNRLYDKDAAHARSLYRSSGGWWYMSDITAFMGAKGINYRYVTLPGTDFLKTEIDNDNIVIVCLDMHPLSYCAENEQRIDKFYSTTPEWGHFLLLYGYVKTDSEIFFEVCDPNSYGKTYRDQTLKGDGRFYRGSEIYRSASVWSSRVCVIEHP